MDDKPKSSGATGYGEFPPLFGGGFETDFVLGNTLHSLAPLIKSLSERKHDVCIIGERGTGKERVAEMYIESSENKEGWHRINCASFTDEVLASELFGHKKGAFTNAIKDRTGLLASLDPGGGIFLDELGASSKRFRAALLRVLQERKFYPLGSDEEVSLKKGVTILAATSEPEEIREDVLDRFMQIHIPPLRYRKEDIPFILRSIWRDSVEKQGGASGINKISESALAYLKDYSWPGNVRELKNALEFAMIVSELTNKSVLRTSSFPTIPMLSSIVDDSKSLFIDKLQYFASAMPIESFISGWSSKRDETQCSKPDARDNAGIIEQCLKTIDHKAYRNRFWAYYASKGFNAKAVLQRFPGIGAVSTIGANLRKGAKTDLPNLSDTDL